MEVPYVFVLRYQGMPAGGASATAHLEWEYGGDWYIARITLRDLDDLRDVDLLPADFLAEEARLYRNRGFCQDAEEVARNHNLGKVSYARELARSAAE